MILANILPGYGADHSNISFMIKFNENVQRNGYWKFNKSLLKDDTYIKLVQSILENLTNLLKVNMNKQIITTEY